jgi:hypothetical protein
MPTKKIRLADAAGSTYFIQCMKEGLQISPGRRRLIFKRPKNFGSPMRQQMDKDHKGEDGDGEGEEDWDNIVDGEAKTISSQQANAGDSGRSSLARILTGKQIAITGILPHLEEGNGLNVGKAQVAAMIQQHGGIIQGVVQGNTNLLIVCKEPGRKKVEEVIARDMKKVALATAEQLFEGTISWEEFMQAPSPIMTKHSSGFQGRAIGQEEVSSKSCAQALAGSMKGTE